jgi:hypothetical protein
MKPKRSAVERLLARRWQKCALCGKRHGKTYKYPFLAEYGIKGKYAAMECLGLLPRPDISNVVFIAPRLPATAEGEEWQREEDQQ